ncbi:crotonase/enoyl-CoA hydratase family protein [Oricola sp.]|uniref:crotonase/enoyl-CoA hydratase family protein n=1 Tax=Oricola sp. TaxID=1979950 RepID=UPI003BAA57D7
MSEHVVVERRGAVQIIRMNRPDKKNAITRAMYKTMADALVAADADDNIRVSVFLGTPGAFSAGNDMQDFLVVATGGEHGGEVGEFLVALASAKKPVLSGVDGLAIGVGTTINLHCDLTFATPASLFRTPFVDLALVPEAGSSLLAPRVMGHQRAFALLAMGEGFTAEMALEAGLIYRVVEAEALEAETLAAAEALAAKPPQALQIARELLKGAPDPVIERIKEEGALFAKQLKSDEAREAFMAFMARKR